MVYYDVKTRIADGLDKHRQLTDTTGWMRSMVITRRDTVKLALAAVPMAKLNLLTAFAQTGSKFDGVQIGIILSPYNFPEIPVRADELLPVLNKLGISAIEMQDVRVETYAGAPSAPREGYSGSPGEGHVQSKQEREEAARKAAAELSQWRLRAPLDKYRALRKLYNDAGVTIYSFRLANMTPDLSDEEYNYFFNAAQAVGANQITVELPEELDEESRRYCRETQDHDGIPQSHPGECAQLGYRSVSIKIQRHQPGRGALCSRHQRVSDSVYQGAPRQDHLPSSQRPQDAVEWGPEHAMGAGRHAVTRDSSANES